MHQHLKVIIKSPCFDLAVLCFICCSRLAFLLKLAQISNMTKAGRRDTQLSRWVWICLVRDGTSSVGSWKQTNTISAFGDYERCDWVNSDVELPFQISSPSAFSDLQQRITGTEFMDSCLLWLWNGVTVTPWDLMWPFSLVNAVWVTQVKNDQEHPRWLWILCPKGFKCPDLWRQDVSATHLAVKMREQLFQVEWVTAVLWVFHR